MNDDQLKKLDDKQIEQFFVGSEYSIESYFNKYIVPKLEFHCLARESQRLSTWSTSNIVTQKWFPSAEYAEDVKLAYKCNDIYATVNDLHREKKMQNDISVLAGGFQLALVSKIGQEKYDALSKQCGGDLATVFVENRLVNKMIDWEAELYKTRIGEYVAKEAKDSSFVVSMVEGLFDTGDTSDHLKPDLERLIDLKIAEKYDPSIADRFKGRLLGVVLDLPLVMVGSFASSGNLAANFAKTVAIDVGAQYALDLIPGESVGPDPFSAWLSKEVYNSDDDKFLEFARQSRNVNPYQNEFVEIANEQLTNKLIVRSSHDPFLIRSGNVFQDSFNRMNKFGMPEIPDYTEKLRLDGEMYWAMREKFGPKENTSQDGEQVSEEEKKGSAVQQQPVSGWDNLLNGLGLNGFSDVGKNLGYVFAMLPDLLIGMFTGQTKRLNISDNLMPIAAIFGGMFVKNPILKMLLIGLGGANLLNKAGHEALDHAGMNSDQVRQYKTYPDEVLDRRIKNPVMQGNTLVADIDGQPLVLPVTDMAVDAYEKGALPLNTLSNAVLRAWDKRQMEVAQNYEQGISEEQEIVRSRGIQ